VSSAAAAAVDAKPAEDPGRRWWRSRSCLRVFRLKVY